MGQGSHNQGAGNTAALIASLRTAIDSGPPQARQEVVSRLDAVEAAVSQVTTEHSGMADELLRAYEQLGVVFELTRQLPTVRTEREVLHLFVQSLQITYPNIRVALVEEDADGELIIRHPGAPWPPWIRQALITCRDERRVVVAACPNSNPVTTNPTCAGCSHPTCGEHPFLRVMCGPIHAGEDFACALMLAHDGSTRPDALARTFDTSDMSLLDSLNLFCGDLIRNFRLVAQLRQLSMDLVRALISAIEQKDEYTSGHSARVGLYAVLLGRELGLDTSELQMLEWSALLHDIGKIGIRDEVLKKPGKLTAEEFRHIQEHPSRSYEVVREVPRLAAALDGVLYHHEHWDGGGYPKGLSGEAIPLQARLIQVADIFDALTSTRSYRQPYEWPKALSILSEEAGTTVDPKIAARFDRMIRRMARDEPQRLREIMSVNRQCGQDRPADVAATSPMNSGNGGA